VVADVERRLEELATNGTRADRITLAGHGEPTLHPDFPAIVDGLRGARDRAAAAARIAILSNSSTAGDPRIRAALRRLDERYMKLDAGDQDTLRHVNATALKLDDIVRALASLGDLVIQAMFVRSPDGRVDNTSPSALGHWLDALAAIRPLEVHLYSLDRTPAWRALEAVPRARLQEIARAVERRGLRAEVF
jgi:wyosine [tRNA(Phe)-imidazoG37] synthetase (radical SAM superfamily)